MLRNSGSLSLPCSRLGVQVVVDNNTIDNILRERGGILPRAPCVDKGL